jgi:autotransporter-associated beta strand protein
LIDQSVTMVTLAGGGAVTGTSGVITGTTFQVQSGTVSARLGGSGSLTKSTIGTVTINSSNLYSGGTTINGGKLRVNNTAGSGTGSGNVAINNSGVLAGTGSISGRVTNNAVAAIPQATSISWHSSTLEAKLGPEGLQIFGRSRI